MRKDFVCKNATDCNFKAYHLSSPSIVLEKSCRPQPGPQGKASIFPPPMSSTGHFQPLLISKNSVQRYCRSVTMPKTCPNHPNLF